MRSADVRATVRPWLLAVPRVVSWPWGPPLLVVLLFYVVPGFAAMRPVIDGDVWWHLRAGEWMVQHHALPRVDPFAAPGAAKPWAADSWLFDLLMHGLYREFGLGGLAVYRFLLCSAILIALLWLGARGGGLGYIAIVVAGLSIAALMPLFAPRSYLFSILLYTVELTLLCSAMESGRWRRLWLLPPIFMLWANVHIQFVYGLLALIVAIVAERLPAESGRSRDEGTGSRTLIEVTVACVALTLATPYHVGLYAKAMTYASQAAIYDVIEELLSPQFRQPADWIMLALALVAARMAGGQKPPRPFFVLLLGVTAFVSFRSSRDTWLLVVSAAAILTAPRGERERAPRPRVAPRRLIAATAIVVGLLGIAAWRIGTVAAPWPAIVAARFPVAAAEIIAERGYPGPVYSPLDWGGYLLWSLPHLSVSIDGRTDVHGDVQIRRSAETWDGRRGWDVDPDVAAAGTVVAPVMTPLATLLLGDPRFDVVYNDAVARVFVARRAQNSRRHDPGGRRATGEEVR